MPEIQLTKGYVAIVDDADAHLADHRWYAKVATNDLVYAARSVYAGDGSTAKTERMHRVIMGAADGVTVDHVNGNTLDNRRSNLRVADRSQQAVNRKSYSGTQSGVKGVQRNGKRWKALITVAKRRIHLGTFDTVAEAARARACAELKYHGEWIRLERELSSDA